MRRRWPADSVRTTRAASEREIEGHESTVETIRRAAAQALGDEQVLGHRQIAFQSVEMAEPGEPAAPGLGIVGGIRALPAHRSGIGPDQARHGAQQGGLAAAVAAGQGQQFALAQPEGQAIEHPPSTAAAGQAIDLEGDLGGGRRHEAPW